MSRPAPLQVGIIGAGIGRQHLQGFLKIEERMRVSVICDLDLARAQTLAQERDYIRVEKDFDQVIRDPEIDIIDICLPPDLHYPFAVKAMEAGKHVICEKPLVVSLAEADLLIEKASAANVCFSPVFQYRYGPAMAEIDALRKAGLTGRPVVASAETHWNRGAQYYATPWRGTWKGEAGGAVLSHAIHNHDLICRIFGNVESLFAYTSTRVNPIETEDCAAITMRMEGARL
jgi:predicted dehydrogenase